MFEFTKQGVINAKKYLVEIDKLDDFNKNQTSVDGYSLVEYANYCYENEED